MKALQHSILYQLIEQILEPEYKQIRRQIDELVDRNKELLGPDTDEGFIYSGKWYARTGMVGRPNQSLHPDLWPTMQRIVDFTKTLTDDKQIMYQVLAKVISECNTYEEVRNELPECVVSLNPLLYHYSRSHEPAKSIQKNERDYRQYQKVLMKIQTYCAMRYLI
jgi:hypothetical protein